MQQDKSHTHDKLDRELISLLRNDGRAPLSKLAKKLNVSRGTVQNRLDRLEASGVLLGFTVRVCEDYGVDTIRAIMMIEVVGKSTTEVIRSLRGFPELITLHSTNGAWDLLAEIQTSSLAEFDRVLSQVRMIDGVLNSETSILLTSV
ncbi:Lrp/AsnC family transcriptional regulator [Leucothrix sargassi]|nr:Lrp/AsnC family transcriptional regulator [Leucothrix sargassi]